MDVLLLYTLVKNSYEKENFFFFVYQLEVYLH